MKVKILNVTGFVLLVIVCSILLNVGRKRIAERYIQPARYAKKAASVLKKELSLNEDQARAIQEILKQHRERKNSTDIAEFDQWETLFANMSVETDEGLEEDYDQIGRLHKQRGELQRMVLKEINNLLTPEQKKEYGSFMVKFSEKKSAPLRKYFQ